MGSKIQLFFELSKKIVKKVQNEGGFAVFYKPTPNPALKGGEFLGDGLLGIGYWVLGR